MKIKKIHPYKFRNDAHFQFYAEFLALYRQYEVIEQKTSVLFELWFPTYQKEDAILKKINKSSITAQIYDADRARDDMYTGMRQINEASLKHFDVRVREAATRLEILFDAYGNIEKKRYIEESSAITNIVQEFEGRYAADVATVGLAHWVLELKARNITFMNLMRDRVDEAADNADVALRAVRIEVDEGFSPIRDQINILARVEGGAIYDEFIKKFNITIDKFALLYKPKGGRGGEEEEQQTDGGTDEN